jgi:hypothetical protein
MTPRPNPYRWDSHVVSPEVELARPELLESTARRLLRGGSVVLLGGRGLGKSVFLRQLEQHLRAQPGVAVFLLEPAGVRSLTGALTELVRVLGLPVRPGAAPPATAQEVIEQFLYKQPETRSVILLFDGVEAYVLGEEGQGGGLARLWFDHLEAVRRNLPRLGVLVAGGRGVRLLRHPLGSAFLSRACRVKLPPLSVEQLAHLARPFAEAGRPLSPESLEALRLASGGNPARATWLLEQLWEAEAQGPEAVAAASARFQREHPAFTSRPAAPADPSAAAPAAPPRPAAAPSADPTGPAS